MASKTKRNSQKQFQHFSFQFLSMPFALRFQFSAFQCFSFCSVLSTLFNEFRKI